jgi:sugar phosphate isomerase/epimerase
VDKINISVNGCNDHKPYDRIPDRAWTFRSIGYGHGVKTWKDIASSLLLIGYDHVISIEHEDGLMSADEGLRKAVATLHEANIAERPGEMYWA